MSSAIAVRDFEFKGSSVRCVGTDRDLWFVAKDVAEALGMVWASSTLSSIPPAWRGVRKLLTPQKNQYGQSKQAEIDVVVINEAAVYKLAFRSNKPEADAFTNWVASEVLPSIRRTGAYVSPRARKYLKAGKEPEWVERREEGIDTRRGFTDVLKGHGVEGAGYALCTDAINRPVLGGTASIVKVERGLKPRASLRDSLSTAELIRIQFAESLAAGRIERDKLDGTGPCHDACRLSGQAVAAAVYIAEEGALSPSTPAPAAELADLPDTCFTPAMGPRS